MFTHSMISLLALTLGAPAMANTCEVASKAIREKSAEYDKMDARNDANWAALKATEAECKAKGDALFPRIAGSAEGLSCVSQHDVSGLDQEVMNLGAHCEERFSQLEAQQEQLRQEFQASKADLDEGLEIMHGNELIKMFCSDDVERADGWAKSFETLGRSIGNVKTHAIKGEGNYAHVKQTGQQLAEKTAQRNRDCGIGEADNKVAGAAPAGGRDPAPVPAGNSLHPSSTVTGEVRAQRLGPVGRTAEVNSVSLRRPAAAAPVAEESSSTITSKKSPQAGAAGAVIPASRSATAGGEPTPGKPGASAAQARDSVSEVMPVTGNIGTYGASAELEVQGMATGGIARAGVLREGAVSAAAVLGALEEARSLNLNKRGEGAEKQEETLAAAARGGNIVSPQLGLGSEARRAAEDRNLFDRVHIHLRNGKFTGAR